MDYNNASIEQMKERIKSLEKEVAAYLNKDRLSHPLAQTLLSTSPLPPRSNSESIDSIEKLKLIFDTMTEGVALNEAVYNKNGDVVDYRILEVNKIFASMADSTTPDITGNLATVVYRMSSDSIAAFWKEHRASGEIIRSEYFNPLSNKWFYVSTSPIVNGKFVTSFFDITNQKKAEESLRESEQRYRALVSTSPAPIVVHQEGKIIFVNDAAVKMFNAAEERQLLGTPVVDRVHPDDVDVVKKRIQNISEKGQDAPLIEEKLLKMDGTVIDAEVAASQVILNGKNAVQIVLLDVTSRKNQERIVKRTLDENRKLSLAVEQSPSSIVITDLDGNIEYVNPRFSAITGYTREDVIGKNPRILKSGETTPEEYRKLWETISNGKEWRGEFHNKKKNGEYYWELASISPVKNEQNILTHFVAVKEDITSRKKVETELQASETKYRLLVENLDEGIWVIDKDAVTTFVNPRMAEILGYTTEEMVGKKLFYFLKESDLQRVNDSIQKRKDGIREHSVSAIVRKDRKQIIVSVETYPIVNERNEYNGAVAALTDITERKRAEEELRKSESHLRSIYNGTTLGLAVGDLTGRFLEINPALRRILGYDIAELQRYSISEITYPDDRAKDAALFKEVLEGRTDHYEIEKRFYHKNGNIIWALIAVSLVFDLDKKPMYAIAMIDDITDRKRNENELRDSRNQLRLLASRIEQIREEERTAIAREIHDELGQNLTGLKMKLSWITKRLSGNQELVEATQRMRDLVDTTIKDVRRISTNLRPGVLDELGLGAALIWHSKKFEEETGIEPFVEIDPDVGTVSREVSTALFRIFQESLTNIARHSGATTVNAKLTLSGNTLNLEISDNGSGIEEKALNDPLSIGLLGMKERALALHGEVKITRHPGTGTSVIASIPL
jgi:PAS domain S-box-containing protein